MADRRVRGLTVGVLSTSFGGLYFGRVMAGIASATAAAGGRLVAVQTSEAGTYSKDLPEPPAFRPPVAWDHVSAFAVILNGVDRGYLEALREAGKPVVMISDTIPGFDCPVVLPDNRTGIEQAVDHLVKHGHSRIAFAGCPVAIDMRERYEAYKDTLRKHGITPDPELFFNTGNNQESGGETAAHAMIASGLPSTAVIMGNDLNAVGLMRVLRAAGYELPRDQAVVGFDDSEKDVYLSPSLASVRQLLESVGATAVELLLRTLRGEDVRAGVHLLPTEFIARESCGCPSTLTLGDTRAAPVEIRNRDELFSKMIAALEEGATQPSPAAVRCLGEAVDLIADTLGAAVAGLPSPNSRRLRAMLGQIHCQCPGPENLVHVLRCVRGYARHLVGSLAQGETEARVRVEDAVQEIVLALSLTQARARDSDNTHFEATFNSQHTVSMRLLRSAHEQDPRRLDWLERTPARAASLGLWVPDPGGTRSEAMLHLAGSYRADHEEKEWTDVLAGAVRSEPVRPEEFPPAGLIELADLDRDEMVFIAPIRVNTSDWGFLAVVGPIESRLATGREIMNQWAAMLTIALDHGAVVEERRAQEELLRRAALYDGLTGLPNRTLFFDRLQNAIDRAKRRTDCRFGVFLLDLDGFKVVNDSLGHLAGDQLLVEAAARIQTTLRANDIAARLGGDEFAVLLDDLADEDAATAVAERLRAVLAEPCVIEGQDIVISASIGIALNDELYEEPQDVIRDADIAMYSVKVREKGTHAVFEADMRSQADNRLRVEGDLSHAIERDQLELHYQPVVELASGRITALEALLRWRDPGRGLVMPMDFLPIAEDCGLSLPIGRWVLNQACRQLRQWHDLGWATGVRMSVNVWSRQFWHGHLLETVRTCLEEEGLEPGSLIIEITEGVVMRDVKRIRKMLRDLHDLGVGLHLDDFGTGYSSLEALHHLPIDALKIDQSFVTPLGADLTSDELIRTIIAMGATLGLDLVAEGIETSGQRSRLQELGCAYGQGYLFTRPMNADDVAAFVSEVLPLPLD
jgi:diguanylate cyclase (GGDEF)-like protein